MRAGTLLLATHSFPPPITQGSRRSAGLVKYLRRLGYRVIVLTSRSTGGEPARSQQDVVRSFDLLGTRANWRRRNIQAHEGREPGHYSATPSRLSAYLVPDPAVVTWVPFATAAALRLARRERIDCVITTAIPQSAHLIGAVLRRRGIPWVADLRDGWTFEAPREWRWRVLDRLDRSLERRLLWRADQVVAVSEPISRDLRARLGLPVTTITNGYDPEAEVGPPLEGAIDEDRHTMVYTGRFAAGKRSPLPLIEALRLIARRDPDAAAGLEVVVAGPLTREEQELFGAPGLKGLLRHIGTLSRGEALWLQAHADGLLVVTAGVHSGEVTGKLFEYVHTRRPILVLGTETEAARIARDTGAGDAVPADDPEAIAAALLGLARGVRSGHDPERLETVAPHYTHERIAERMAAVIESARRDAQGGPGSLAGRGASRTRFDLDEGPVPEATEQPADR